MEVVRIAEAGGRIVNAELLARAETVHRQLRPQIPEPYAGRMAEIFAGGAEMVAALVDGDVAGVCMFRLTLNTFSGRVLYIDDLVADSGGRGKGVGKALMDFAVAEAKARECVVVQLSSGCQREQAHRFYFREGFTIKTFGFFRAP
ncbi:MAG: GNAT family N-acetyltransferase [Pseudomonadota bacterium]|nr:GNAT family N-acetyltransferase [Pseudomonadota bacterium]